MIYTDLIFVFLFLPVYAVLMLALRERYEKNLAAVVMSLIFFVWGRPLYYALIFLNIFTTYAAGRLSTKHNYNVIRITVTSLAAVSSAAAAVALASDNTVKGAVSAFGVLLFALRCGLYLRDAEDGGEKNIINLCVYLMSFEFMAVSPVLAYSEIKEGIEERKTNLAMLSGGLERFVGGLAAYSILGYSLERVRQAALFGDSLPYINAIVGVIATAVEFYVVICAYLAMSEGLCLIGGYRIKMWDSSFTPRSLVKNHLGYAYLSLAAVLNSVISGKKPYVLCAWLGILCIAVGFSLGFGAGAMAFAGIIAAAMLMQSLFESKKSVASGIFTALAFALGFVVLANGSLTALGRWFGGFNLRKYDFDISFVLYTRLKESWVWLVIAVIYASPLRRIAERWARERMSENEAVYGTVRTLGAVLSGVLVILSAAAMISAGGAY